VNHDRAGRAGVGAVAGWELAALALVVAAAATLRLGALPGSWNADSCFYVETLLSGTHGAEPREQRQTFLWCVEAALRVGGGRPAWASAPGVLSSLAVVPCLWLALRDRLPPFAALVPAAVWAVLPLDLHQSAQVSSDAFAAAPSAFAVLALTRASRAERRLGWLLAAGAAAGFAAHCKETTAPLLVAMAAGAFAGASPGSRLRSAVAVLGTGAVVFAGATLLLSPDRIRSVSAHTASASWLVRPGDPRFPGRMTTELASLLLTDAHSFGLVFAALAPCLARLPFVAARGNPLASAALAGLLCAQFLPASPSGPAFLPLSTEAARYLVWLFPLLLAASAEVATLVPRTAAERIAAAAAALAMLALLSSSAAAAALLAVVALCACWRRRAEGEDPRIPTVHLATVAAAPAVAAGHSNAALACWVVGTAVAVVGPTSSRHRSSIATAAILLGGISSFLTLLPTLRSSPLWDAWDTTPAAGSMVATPSLGRRLRIAARLSGRDDARIVAWESNRGPPTLGPDDRWVVTPDPAVLTSLDGAYRVVSDRGSILVLAPASR